MKKIEKNTLDLHLPNLILKSKGKKNLEILNIITLKIAMKEAIHLDEVNILTKDITNYLKNMEIKIQKLLI